MSFKILLNRKTASFLKGIEPHLRARIVKQLRTLEIFPKTRIDIVKVAGEEDTFRLRIGKYRALFKAYKKEKIIVVVKIDLRKKVYEH